MKEIHFYIREEPYGWLSNFERTPFRVGVITYPTNEHYYQSQKGSTPVIREYIRQAPNATIAMGIGRMLEQPIYDKYLRDDWYDDSDTDWPKKLDVMLKGLRHKFKDPILRKLLFSTGDKILHEHTEDDFFWGDGGNGEGESWLGRLLMKVREEIKSESMTKEDIN